jgi:hypothetical protein
VKKAGLMPTESKMILHFKELVKMVLNLVEQEQQEKL